MNLTDIPTKISVPFARDAGPGFIRPIPVPAQTASPTDAPASYTEGFPPETFNDVSAGGVPVNGQDVNGILNAITEWTRWLSTGVPARYDAAFATAMGGYPATTILQSTASIAILWQSTVDGNTTNPDGGSPANWRKVVPTKASAADFQAGTDDTLFLTAKSVADGLGTGNVMRYPNGVIEQWGRVAFSSAGQPVVSASFPTAYQGADYGLQVSPVINNAGTVKDTWVQVILSSKSTTGFSVQYQNSTDVNAGLDGFEWRTIGR